MPRHKITVRVQSEDFQLDRELAQLRRDNPQVGASVSFIGYVRDINNNLSVANLELEHYPGMTEKSITAIVEDACDRWQLQGATVIHRVGKMLPSDQIVMVAVISMHRGEAFHACEFIMDYLKTKAPFWKKELTEDGEVWVESRQSDDESAQRWDKQ